MPNKTIAAYLDNGPEESYEQWFRRQVEEMVALASQPEAEQISQGDLEAELAARRRELMSKLKDDS